MKFIDDIKQSVAKIYGIPPEEISGQGRTKEIYVARSHAIYVSFQEGHSCKDIGVAFNRDLTSVHASLGAYICHRRALRTKPIGERCYR